MRHGIAQFYVQIDLEWDTGISSLWQRLGKREAALYRDNFTSKNDNLPQNIGFTLSPIEIKTLLEYTSLYLAWQPYERFRELFTVQNWVH